MVSYLGFKVKDMGFDAHLTVLYLGYITHDQEKIARVNEFLAMNRDELSGSDYVIRHDIELFGPEKNLPVVTVMVGKHLWAIRKMAELQLWNASEFKDWNPHITLDLEAPGDLRIPKAIKVSDFGLY